MTGDGATTSERRDGPRIAVVGPCASGKSTLAAGLRGLGYDAFVSGQEHSEIATLWDHLHPDLVIGLTIDLATLRERRGEHWSATLYETQMHRLESAYAHAGLVIDAAESDAAGVLARAAAFLASREANLTIEDQMHEARFPGDGDESSTGAE